MKTKKMILNAILIAIGVILHIAAPSIEFPAQPDFAIAMLFIIIVLNKDYKTTIIAGIIMGIFTAMTTKTPGGQLPNMIDKIVTCNVMFLLLKPFRERINRDIQMGVLLLLGTMISGVIFLSSLAILYGIEGSIITAIIVIVIPTAIINVVIGLILFKVVERAIKLTRIKIG